MTFLEYAQQADATRQYRGTPRERLNYTSIALGGEVGEFLNAYKKFLRTAVNDGGTPAGDARAALLDELGDVLWYLNQTARELDSTLEKVASMNLLKLAQRYAKE